MTFDNNGNLFPYQPNAITFDEFEIVFGFDDHRKLLLTKLSDFIKELKSIVHDDIQLWVDGSFVTKKENPKDIDVVVFIGFQHIESHHVHLATLKEKQEFVDLYYVKVFPDDHTNYQLTQLDRLDWLHFFVTDRRNKRKGFIELTF